MNLESAPSTPAAQRSLPLDGISNRRVASALEVVTPAQARVLRATCHFPRQRPISRENVQFLAGEMRAGRFLPGLQIYFAQYRDGSRHIVNGNHTLNAVVEADVPQTFTVTTVWVADEREAGELYALFDRQKVRTLSDSLRASGTRDAVPMATKVAQAVAFIMADFGQTLTWDTKRPHADIIGRLEADYVDAANDLNIAFKGAPRTNISLVQRAAVLAVALETTRAQPSAAVEFWGRVVQDDGLSKGMPERALLQWLRGAPSTAGHEARYEHARAAAMTWNNAFRERPMDAVRIGNMSAFYMAGTDWTLDRGRKLAGL